jgi:hypothetical protein
MKCLYYLAPTLASTRQVTDDLHAAGIRDFFVTSSAKDESGLKSQHIHSSNYLETLDIVRDGFIGAAIGVLAGLVGAALLFFFDPFPGVPRVVYFMIVVLFILFGAWEGGLTGIATENKKLPQFHHEIEAGKYVILIYAARSRERPVRDDDAREAPRSRARGDHQALRQSVQRSRRRHTRERQQRALQKD